MSKTYGKTYFMLKVNISERFWTLITINILVYLWNMAGYLGSLDLGPLLALKDLDLCSIYT